MFWPPAIVLLFAVGASLVDFDGFLAKTSEVNNWLLDKTGWLIALAAFGAVLLVGAVSLTGLGKVRIGGEGATPILSRWNWFAITLCTTIATGILFWGAAEPLYHFGAPPSFSGAVPNSLQAAQFSLSTLYLHWAITPYAIYAVPSIAFALAYYNLGKDYSLSGPLSVAMGRDPGHISGAIVDALALFALVAGVAASLGAGIMTLSGGIAAQTPITDSPLSRLAITIVIVATYVVSSLSGLQRGIKILSDINVRVFFMLAGFVLLFGPTADILNLGVASLGSYVADFVPRSLNVFGGPDEEWLRDWTVFYFANWLAWAPITALFLGRISYGYTVREAVLFNLVVPAVFGMAWMTIFGGASLSLDIASNFSLSALLAEEGPQAIIYGLFEALPLTALVIGVFMFATFVSFVTAMDSNTHSIASVCLRAKRQSDEVKKSGMGIKLFWGLLIGAVAWIMTSTSGIDGIRMLSNLGGAPGLLILIGSMVALFRFALMDKAALNGARHEATANRPL